MTWWTEDGHVTMPKPVIDLMAEAAMGLREEIVEEITEEDPDLHPDVGVPVFDSLDPKTQVFALAEYLGVPAEIRARVPTTDTFSLAQTQEEFYFALPHEQMDLCLWARDHDVTPDEAAGVVELTPDQVERVYRDIDAKRRVSRYLHHRPAVAEAEGAA